jgi:hypothetical protein
MFADLLKKRLARDFKKSALIGFKRRILLPITSGVFEKKK